MPEPAVASKHAAVDEYDRDTDDPYWVCDSKAKLLEKLRFLGLPVCLSCILGRGIFWEIPYMDWANRFYPYNSITHALQCDAFTGIFSNYFTMKQLRNLGARPGAYSCRQWVLLGQLVHVSVTVFGSRASWGAHLHTLYHTFAEYGMPSFDASYRAPAFCVIVSFFSIQAPDKYGDFSPYGVYCCAKSKQARMVRCLLLGVINAFYTFWFWFFLTLSGKTPGIREILPLLVFGWKRVQYNLDISIVSHDNPYKGHAMITTMHNSLVSFNIAVSSAGVGVATWEASITFVAVDWLIFGSRIIIVGRFGEKVCGKIVKTLILKQLESLPAPLANHSVACGDKTSMRVQQAFLCLIEGESMTSCYACLILIFFYNWVLRRDLGIIYVVPMRSMWIIMMYTILDFVQDLLADHLTKKFNDWSYLYHGSGWCAKKMMGFHICLSLGVGYELSFTVGAKSRAQRHMPRSSWPFEFKYVWSPPGLLHY